MLRTVTRPQFTPMSYDAFAEAADTFGGFGTTGEEETRKREIAAFWLKLQMQLQVYLPN